MAKRMRCLFCGLLQDEPVGVKECQRCGGELIDVVPLAPSQTGSYLLAQMELDQVSAPAGQMVDRHLLLTLRTPKEVPEEHAAQTESGRPPLSFHAVVDISGSMQGSKIEQTRQALHMASRLLREGDVVSVSVFSNEPRLVLKPTAVNQQTKKLIESVINEIQAGGMTALYGGLDLGIQQAKEGRAESNLILLLSDGQANVGETDLEVVGQLASEAAKNGLVVSTMGVGLDYNEALMTEIATQGRGRYYHIQSSDQIVPYLTGELGEAADLAARNVQIHIRLPEGTTAIPLSSAYKAELSEGGLVVSIGDIPADLEVEIPLRLTLFSGKDGERLSIDGEVQYHTPAGSQLATALNRVTVRFITQQAFKLDMGVVKPVAERVAHQMRATQVLHYSRAVARGNPPELKQADQERNKLREYLQLLDRDIASQIAKEMDEDLHAVRASSPRAKNIMGVAYRAQRFMRNLDDQDNK